MIDQVLWQQTVLIWACWWIEHPVQYRVFKMFDFLRTCLLYTILVCMFFPILPMLVIGFGAALLVAFHWLLFQLYAHFVVKPAFMSYLLRGAKPGRLSRRPPGGGPAGFGGALALLFLTLAQSVGLRS